MSPTKKQKPKNFQFRKNLNQKTSRIFRWSEQLSSSIGWRVMVVQSDTRKSCSKYKYTVDGCQIC